ncbi:hypothetical protein BG004_001860, partial [Podila humilis]
MARHQSTEQAPSIAESSSSSFSTSSSPSPSLDRRTLVGDEYTVNNQIDNSRGKHTFSIDHNGDSSVRKGLLYDLVDPSPSSGNFFHRRSLLGNLFGGGDKTTIENVNDNSQHKQTMNSHGNKDVKITKIHREQHGGSGGSSSGSGSMSSFFDRRDLTKRSLLGDLVGSDSTSISNQNDNSKHTQTMNSHGNKNIKITKIRKEQHRGGGGSGSMSPETFFDRRRRRDLDPQEEDREQKQKNSGEAETIAVQKRSLLGDLFGGDSTSISNVNDNSKHTQTMNSHGNKNIKITKIRKDQRRGGGGSGSGGGDGHGRMSPESFFDRRDLGETRRSSNDDDHDDGTIQKRSLLGDLVGNGDNSSTSVSNQNDKSKHTQVMNSHNNKHMTVTRIHRESQGHNSGGSRVQDLNVVMTKRGLLFGGKSTTISNVNDNSQSTKTLNSHDNTDKMVNSYIDRYYNKNNKKRKHHRRGLLFGEDSITVNNENYNGKETKIWNEHDNVDKTIVHKNTVGITNDDDEYDEYVVDEEGDEDWDSLVKRDSISVSNLNDNSKTTKTLNSHDNVYFQQLQEERVHE